MDRQINAFKQEKGLIEKLQSDCEASNFVRKGSCPALVASLPTDGVMKLVMSTCPH